jgi:hypothetical protein
MCFYHEGLFSCLNYVIPRYGVFLGKSILGRSADTVPTFMESATWHLNSSRTFFKCLCYLTPLSPAESIWRLWSMNSYGAQWSDTDRQNRSTRRKTRRIAILSSWHSAWTVLELNTGLRSEMPATNRPSHCAAALYLYMLLRKVYFNIIPHCRFRYWNHFHLHRKRITADRWTVSWTVVNCGARHFLNYLGHI